MRVFRAGVDFVPRAERRGRRGEDDRAGDVVARDEGFGAWVGGGEVFGPVQFAVAEGEGVDAEEVFVGGGGGVRDGEGGEDEGWGCWVLLQESSSCCRNWGGVWVHDGLVCGSRGNGKMSVGFKGFKVGSKV